MSMTVNVGYSQKLGQPEYSSLGVCCHVECELDGRTTGEHVEAFQQQVRELFAACRETVQQELARQRDPVAEPAVEPKNSRQTPTSAQAPSAAEKSQRNGSASHRASSKQVEYLRQLSRQIPGIGPRSLEALSQRVCGKPVVELSTLDASSLIDMLKAIKEGKLDAEQVLEVAGD